MPRRRSAGVKGAESRERTARSHDLLIGCLGEREPTQPTQPPAPATPSRPRGSPIRIDPSGEGGWAGLSRPRDGRNGLKLFIALRLTFSARSRCVGFRDGTARSDICPGEPRARLALVLAL